MFFANDLCNLWRNSLSLHLHDLRSQVLRKSKVLIQRSLIFRSIVPPGIYVDYVKHSVDSLSHPGRARNQVLRYRIGTDADGDPLTNRRAALHVLLFHVAFQAAIHHAAHLPQREFTQSNEIARTKEVCESAVTPLHGIYITALHASLQSLWRQIGENDFIHSLHHPIRHGLAHDYAGDASYKRSYALDVLNIHRGDYVNLCVQDLHHIFVAFAMFSALDVSVRELVHQYDFGMSLENGVNIHFVESRALVNKLLSWHNGQARSEFSRDRATVALHHADHHFLAPAMPANALAQHAVRLAYARRIAEKELEASTLLVRCGFLQPLLRCLRHTAPIVEQLSRIVEYATITSCAQAPAISSRSLSIFICPGVSAGRRVPLASRECKHCRFCIPSRGPLRFSRMGTAPRNLCFHRCDTGLQLLLPAACRNVHHLRPAELDCALHFPDHSRDREPALGTRPARGGECQRSTPRVGAALFLQSAHAYCRQRAGTHQRHSGGGS